MAYMAMARDLGAPASWSLECNGTLSGSLELLLELLVSVTRELADIYIVRVIRVIRMVPGIFRWL